ncbi:MAG: mechanosensitive ion channel, partial [Anaerolineales bacterium]|nr:mechanosensitive ion channel [Anaerolineales bacterium]
PVGVGYKANPDIVRRVVLEAVQNVPGFVPEPAALVGFSNFGDSALELSIYFWIDTALTNPVAARDAALSLVKDALDKQKISIVSPMQTMYLTSRN